MGVSVKIVNNKVFYLIFLKLVNNRKMQLCSGSGENEKCLDNDTIIVLLYAAFCVVFGIVVALMVMWADRRRSGKTKSTGGNVPPHQNNVEAGEANEEDVELEEVYKSVTKLEDVQRKFSINRKVSQ